MDVLVRMFFTLFTIIICGVVSGLLGALLGLGGAVILTPLLTILLDLPIQYAAGISLISALATSIMSGIKYVPQTTDAIIRFITLL